MGLASGAISNWQSSRGFGGLSLNFGSWQMKFAASSLKPSTPLSSQKLTSFRSWSCTALLLTFRSGWEVRKLWR